MIQQGRWVGKSYKVRRKNTNCLVELTIAIRLCQTACRCGDGTALKAREERASATVRLKEPTVVSSLREAGSPLRKQGVVHQQNTTW